MRNVPSRTAARLGALAIGFVSAFSNPGLAAGPGKIEYNRDIRPILSENCFACHGPDAKNRKAKLRLDDREAAIKAGAIAPGKVEGSEVLARIASRDADEVMPPSDSNKSLTAAQKDTLRRWIEQGAEYQAHWAYVPPRKVEPPKVSRPEWVRNPIDAFLLATLDARKIDPSPEADQRTLLRRLSLDLTGLPPTPQELEAFLADNRPDAYERQVDRLLASPHYGERMAVPWLDLVRFADTVGYHGDQNANVFPYRDYVINAFNANKPFDRFTVEQLAGDLLPNPTAEQRVATGFNRLNMMTREGGAQPKEYLAKYAADRVRTVSMTWLGSTMGCCECHDHKYDPFRARDFYRLSAFFADVKQWGVYSDYGYTPNPDLKGWSNDHPFPPEVEVESPYLMRRREKIEGQIDRLLAEASTKADAKEVDAWRKAILAQLKGSTDGWQVPEAKVGGKSKDADVALLKDGSLLVSAKPKKGDSLPIHLRPGAGWVASLRVEALPHETHNGLITRNGADTAAISLTASLNKGGKSSKLAFSWADADRKSERYSNGSAVLGTLGSWRTAPKWKGLRQTGVWILDRPVQIAEGDELVVTLKSDNVGRVRLSVSPIAFEEPRAAVPDRQELGALKSPEVSPLLRRLFVLGTGLAPQIQATYLTLRKDHRECRDGRSMSMVTEAWKPAATRVLPRGNWQDESGEVVDPGVPGFLPQPKESGKRRLTRLDLANWIVSPENPLTTRVFMNRLWKQFFGNGLSSTLEDVGAQGEAPSHPELLDWLAIEFRESGWDVKKAVRAIVTSSTYRQDSRLRPELREIDPNNRLLASQSPRRLEAEFVRDNALAIAGLLNLDLGGPSAFPYQPPGYYTNIQFPDRDYVPNRDARQYRRGLYAHWQRTFLQPMLANFDAPSREECTAVQTVANTPQQALTLLNDPTFVEAARVLAGKLLAEKVSDATRLDRLYEKALARTPRPSESKSLLDLLARMRREYQAQPGDADKLAHVGLNPATGTEAELKELAAWTNVVRVVLNLHESITRY